MPDINTLREVLFETLQGVKSGTLDIDRADATNRLAQTIINTAKVEIDHMRLTGGSQGSGFLPSGPGDPLSIPTGNGTKLVEKFPAGTITTHRMK